MGLQGTEADDQDQFQAGELNFLKDYNAIKNLICRTTTPR